jgi:hypothetical protein
MTAEFQPEIRRAQVPVDRDWFMRALIRELAGTLEEVIGIEETDGYMSVVGSALGAMIDREYPERARAVPPRPAPDRERPGRPQTAHRRRLLYHFGG